MEKRIKDERDFPFLHTSFLLLPLKRSCWWLLARCSPLPIPNREVKPGTADDTWVKPGKVGSRHNTITKQKASQKCEAFLRFGRAAQAGPRRMHAPMVRHPGPGQRS